MHELTHTDHAGNVALFAMWSADAQQDAWVAVYYPSVFECTGWEGNAPFSAEVIRGLKRMIGDFNMALLLPAVTK